MGLFGQRRPNVRRLARRGDIDGLRDAIRYREASVGEDGWELDLGVAVRVEAADALPQFDGPEVARDLALALDDREPAVRRAVVEAIAKSDTPIAARALAQCVAARDDGAEAASDRALELLEGWGMKGPAELLVARLLKPNAPALDDRHRNAIDRLIAADPRGDGAREEIAARILSALDERPDEPAEGRAERILSWLGRPVVDIVVDALADGRAAPAVVRVAGLLGDARAVEPIIRSLGSPDPEMRRSAAVAAGTLNHTQAVLALLAATRDDEQAVRDAASSALDRMGTAAVIAAMATFVQLGADDRLPPGDRRTVATQILPRTREALTAARRRERVDAAAQPPPLVPRRRVGLIERLLFGRGG